jgi:1-acyl-sn-glycerol-3-phosphate acyltransferase
MIVIHFAITGILGTLFCIFRPFNPSNVLPFARMTGLGTKILGIKFQLINRHNFYLKKPFVAVSNHQHNIDVIFCGAAVPPRTVSMGKKIIKYFPLFGQFYWLSGNILIDRANRKSAFNTIDKSTEALRSNSTSIWIMPEGTRNKGNGIKKFKKGAFVAAINAGVPIIPVSISTYVKFVNVKKWNAGKVAMKIHDPIETTDYSLNDWDKLANKCHQIVSDGIDEIDAQIEKELGYNYKA